MTKPAASMNTAHIPQDVLQTAMQWQVLLWSGETTPEEEQAWQHWCRDSPTHQRAWLHVQQVSQQLESVHKPIASRVLRKTNGQQERRKVLLTLGIALGAGLLAHSANRPLQALTADYRTRVGERRTVLLPDGSKLTLNTDSAANLQITPHALTVSLLQGELLLISGPETYPVKRPLWVSTEVGTVRPVGTMFTVRALNQCTMQVRVLEGATVISPKHGASLKLASGLQTCFDSRSVQTPSSLPENATAWRHGLLIAEREPLAEVAAELGRYMPGLLRCDPAVANLIVSGVYPLNNPEVVLNALAHALPIRINRLTRYWTTLAPA